MAFSSSAGADANASRPLGARARTSALRSVARSAVADTSPRPANPSAEPRYSGTRSTYPCSSAGNTISREPRFGRTVTRYPADLNARPYSSASSTLSGKSNDPMRTTGGPGAGGDPPARRSVHAPRRPDSVPTATATATARRTPWTGPRSATGIGVPRLADRLAPVLLRPPDHVGEAAQRDLDPVRQRSEQQDSPGDLGVEDRGRHVVDVV